MQNVYSFVLYNYVIILSPKRNVTKLFTVVFYKMRLHFTGPVSKFLHLVKVVSDVFYLTNWLKKFVHDVMYKI